MKSVTNIFMNKVVNDPELRRLADGHGEGCIGFTNIRRAAEGDPLHRRDTPAEVLIGHLETCRYCRREVELYREAIKETEGVTT